MKISTKARHAVTAMLDLALNGGRRPVSLADISVKQGVCLSTLEQLFSRLRNAGLVAGVRGPGGGYRLCKDATVITIAEIIEAVDKRLDVGGKGRSLTHALWHELSKQFYGYLGQINLAEFLARPNVMALIEEESRRQPAVPPRLGARSEVLSARSDVLSAHSEVLSARRDVVAEPA